MKNRKKNGLRSTSWGPSIWFLIEQVAYWYPDNPSVTDSTNASLFIEATALILPCGLCREDFSNALKYVEWDRYKQMFLVNRMSFCRLVNLLHNKVNERLHKPKLYNIQEHMLVCARRSHEDVIQHLRMSMGCISISLLPGLDNVRRNAHVDFIESLVYALPKSNLKTRLENNLNTLCLKTSVRDQECFCTFMFMFSEPFRDIQYYDEYITKYESFRVK